MNIKNILYTFKKLYGVALTIYTISTSDVDLETGAKTVTKTTYEIKKGILLPQNIIRDAIQVLGEGEKFKYGGNVDKSIRIMIVDAKDYPSDYTVQVGDYIITNNKRYNIKTAELFDSRQAAIIVMEESKGEKLGAIFNKDMNQDLNLYHTAVGTL